MKFLFFTTLSVVLFLAFSPGQFTPSLFYGHDKLAHVFAFFVLSFGMNISFPSYSIRRLFLIMALLAEGIEWVQFFATTREMSIADFGAGMVGVLIYLSLLKIVTKTYSAFGKLSKSTL